jgi:hypothetical protein
MSSLDRRVSVVYTKCQPLQATAAFCDTYWSTIKKKQDILCNILLSLFFITSFEFYRTAA